MRYARVLTKALAITSHLQPVVNSRLLAIIRSKLWRMGRALSRKSTAQRKLIFDRWQKSDWTIELDVSEMRSVIIEENVRLACQLEKKTSEVERLKEENDSMKVTLDEAKDENACLHMELTSEKTKNEELQQKLNVEPGNRLPLQPLNGPALGSRKRKSWEEYSTRHKTRKIQKLKDKVMDLRDDQLEVTAVHIRNKDTGSSAVIPADAGVQVTAEVPQQSTDHLKKVLLVKDRYLTRPTMNFQCSTSIFRDHVQFKKKQPKSMTCGRYLLSLGILQEHSNH